MDIFQQPPIFREGAFLFSFFSTSRRPGEMPRCELFGANPSAFGLGERIIFDLAPGTPHEVSKGCQRGVKEGRDALTSQQGPVLTSSGHSDKFSLHLIAVPKEGMMRGLESTVSKIDQPKKFLELLSIDDQTTLCLPSFHVCILHAADANESFCCARSARSGGQILHHHTSSQLPRG